MQAREDEGREVPDRLFRTEVSQRAPRESTAHGEGQGDDLPVEEGGEADQRPHGCAGIRARDQADQERPFERQVGGVVLQQQPRPDREHQRDPQGQRKRQPVRPCPLFEDQDVAKATVPDQHRRQRRHHRKLDQEGRQQDLHDLLDLIGRVN
jgi:hypothetical protein